MSEHHISPEYCPPFFHFWFHDKLVHSQGLSYQLQVRVYLKKGYSIFCSYSFDTIFVGKQSICHDFLSYTKSNTNQINMAIENLLKRRTLENANWKK